MDKETFVEVANKLNLQFNSLSKEEEIALIALLCVEEIGCEKSEGLSIGQMIVEFIGSNNSALRQKINRLVFDKATPKNAKESAADKASRLLDNL